MSNLEISRATRLDQYVTNELGPLVSRSFAAKLILDGSVTVDGKVVEKTGYKIKTGDVIVIDYDVSQLGKLPSIELPIVYEDADCVVISKPIGLLTHSKGEFNPEASVASWLAQRLADDLSEVVETEDGRPLNNRAGIVHRLDRATSGVMICAKNAKALSWLQKQFSQRKTKKTYVALVTGHLTQAEAVIDMPIERNPKSPATFRVGANGKSAVTHYRVLEESEHYSLVELKPVTGRTHQLRVHLQKIGHPIVGDLFYGGQEAERLYLHAVSLELTLPDRSRQTFEVSLPTEFKEKIDGDQ